MTLGVLEFHDNPFVRAVMEQLHDVPAEYIRLGGMVRPSSPPYRVVIDRLSFCDPFLRAVVRSWSIGGTYVLNDPFFTEVFDKLSEIGVYEALGIRHARTVALPRINRTENLGEMVAQPDWEEIGAAVGFPCILKPVDGYAWQDVFKVEDPTTLRSLYEAFGDSRTLMVQEMIRHTAYYRAYCVDKRDVFIAGWKPAPFDHGEYFLPEPVALRPVSDAIAGQTIALNAALGLDFNTVEWCVDNDGAPVVIDSYNDVPDVRPEKLPPPCWDWVVERFSACVRARLAGGERNGFAPRLPPGRSDSGPGARG
jgi:hypothetical protein